MISFADVQTTYNRLYAAIRKYIWDFYTVVALADLEIAVYKTCQDIPDIRSKFYRLRACISDVMYEDSELRNRADAFEALLNEPYSYVKLQQVNEVIQ